ncbi:hypothetical protein [Thermoflexus hugenholtzii]
MGNRIEVRDEVREPLRPATPPETEEPILIRYLREALERLPAPEPPPIPSTPVRIARAPQARFNQD